MLFAENALIQEQEDVELSDQELSEALIEQEVKRSKSNVLVAIVNTDVITQKDLDDFINFMRMQMSAQYSKQEIEQRINTMLADLINRLIEDRLILQAAYKENIIVSPARIKARAEQIKKNYPSEADFQNALVLQGLNLADIELKIKEQLLMAQIIDERVRSEIVVRPQEVTDYYYAHIDDFNIPEQRQVRCLIINDSNLAEHIHNTISEYKDFDQIVERHSLEINDFGWVVSGQLRKEIAEAVFNLEAGELSPLLDLDQGFYIFEVKAIKPPGKMQLSETQEQINRIIFETKMQKALVEWLEELKSKAYIEIKHEYGAS